MKTFKRVLIVIAVIASLVGVVAYAADVTDPPTRGIAPITVQK